MIVRAKTFLFYGSRRRAGTQFKLDHPDHFCKITMEEVIIEEGEQEEEPPKKAHKPKVTPGDKGGTGNQQVI